MILKKITVEVLLKFSQHVNENCFKVFDDEIKMKFTQFKFLHVRHLQTLPLPHEAFEVSQNNHDDHLGFLFCEIAIGIESANFRRSDKPPNSFEVAFHHKSDER